MAYLKEILDLISDKTGDVTSKATKLDAIIDKRIADLDAAVTTQEGAKLEAIKTRDAAKKTLRRFESAAGVDPSTDYDIAVVVSALKKNGKESELVDTRDREIVALKAEISTNAEKYSAGEEDYKQQLLSVVLDKDIASILPKYKAKATAGEYITDGIRKQAHFEDGRVVFKNADGTTRRVDGGDAGVEDIIKEMQAKEIDSKTSMFFDIAPEKSGAGNSGGGKAQEGDYIPFSQR